MSEKGIYIVQKATIYDLKNIFRSVPEKVTYTVDELNNLFDTYIKSQMPESDE